MALQFGLDTFGDVTRGADGERISDAQTIRNVVDQARLADELGINFFGIGEHHRAEYAVSSPEMVLSAIASVTKNIQLGTGVNVLSSDDPVRVYEKFATLDAVSSGRAEIVVGRGSFIESFPLFGFSLNDYEVLFEEKLELLTTILNDNPSITWTGHTRASLTDVELFPKTEHKMPVWVGVGGSPESVVRAARYGHGLALAIIGGSAQRFRPFVDLFHKSVQTFGFSPQPVAVHSPGYIAATDEEAWDATYEHVKAMSDKIGAERGWPPYTRAQFQHEVGPDGAQYVGSVERVAQKIAATARALEIDRFDFKYASGPMPHENLMSSIELYGTQVIPRVRELLGE
ncbi:LLM class flavin-dependent oxidoreductase [Microbacterium mitrae]|uniref:LLM class flavin-dependent oxidoreductase n=1 Tax=Microbacterium mitrae TaxID=664640 RepID=A0A5C8HQ03_9MICO|nr:LLM class flavin-dependent oxidoreductase [Microbacterium mitrae]TXK05567.1 LLM class flavin-dependent oxidoreductase [Microbacterium mitrae]